MRARDALLYHLRKLGYRITGFDTDVEFWTHPDNPLNYLAVSSSHDISRDAVTKTVKMARLRVDEILSPPESEDDAP